MGEITIKLPDIGEGIAEAEISEWEVEIGDWIQEDDVIGAVLTDKAAVEIPSSVSGKLLWRAGGPGDKIAVGAPLVRIEVSDEGAAPEPEGKADEPVGDAPAQPAEALASADTADMSDDEETDGAADAAGPPPALERNRAGKVLAAPALRKRAMDLGIDLSVLAGSGPDGRVTHADLDRHLAGQGGAAPATAPDGVTETRIIGLRRKIAEQMSRAHSSIPQITIVEEVDVTELERLRGEMNAERGETGPKLTLLPFLVRAVDRARSAAPQVNALYDDEAGLLRSFDALHCGIATQTPKGLMVPVLRNAGTRDMRGLASEILRLSEGARAGSLSREELSGSTFTITSLGPLGAIATTPIINHPEVAILGVNRKQVRPVWDGREFRPREVMNLSASFDHRIVDGWDAAQFIARLKSLLETPARLFT